MSGDPRSESVIAVLPSGVRVRVVLGHGEVFDTSIDRWTDAIDRALAGEGEPATAEEVGRAFFIADGVALHEIADQRGGSR